MKAILLVFEYFNKYRCSHVYIYTYELDDNGYLFSSVSWLVYVYIYKIRYIFFISFITDVWVNISYYRVFYHLTPFLVQIYSWIMSGSMC